jgi:hypothetical protein
VDGDKVGEHDTAAGTAYFVNERPQVTWAWDLEERNLRFLRSIDPAYFTHIARTQVPLLAKGDATAQYAAAAIRITHAQAIETLFALLGAMAQAPNGPIGWMLAYSNSDLRAVTASLVSRPGLIERSMWEGGVTLSDLSRLVVDRAAWDREKKDEVAKSFLRLWNHWSKSILDENQVAEYNSFKHGSRAALGGHTVAVGHETTPGAVAAPEGMVSLGGSAFGSTFYKPVALDGWLHRYPRQQSHNWNVEGLVAGLELLAISIGNVTSSLRILGGDDPTQCRFEVPENFDAFDVPLTPVGGLRSSSVDLRLGIENIDRLTKAEVLAKLTPDSHADGTR